MKTNNATSCPISGEKGNEAVIRLIAFLVVVIAVLSSALSIYAESMFGWMFLSLDFALRASKNEHVSILRWIATGINRLAKLEAKPVDLAPKRFAAWVGFAFSASLLTLSLLDYEILFFSISSVLILCAILESVFAFCIGCIVYQLIQRLKIA